MWWRIIGQVTWRRECCLTGCAGAKLGTQGGNVRRWHRLTVKVTLAVGAAKLFEQRLLLRCFDPFSDDHESQAPGHRNDRHHEFPVSRVIG